MKYLQIVLVAALAFGAGALLPRETGTASAQPMPPQPTTIDLATLDPATFPPPNPALPNLRTKTLTTVDATVFALSVGTAPKHYHSGTTEVQLVLDGTGTEWLGDKQIDLKPGTLVIIPPNTNHGGLTGGPFRVYTVKTPPRCPTIITRPPE